MATKKDTTEKVIPEGYTVIKLPLTRTEKEDVWVGINGKGYLIKRGEEVAVPNSVVEVLQRQEEALSDLMEFEDSIAGNLAALEAR